MPTAGDDTRPDVSVAGADRSPVSEPAAAVPTGRYGTRDGAADARSERRLKIVGGVLGAVFVAFLVWVGVAQITGQPVTGKLTGFTVVSDTEVEATLQVRKPAGATGVCTVRSQADDGLEVGRVELRFDDDTDSIHRAVTFRTTQRATSAELLGCTEDSTP